MSRERISKATRNEFREILTKYTLREIAMIFDAGNLKPLADYQATVGGERRGLIEAYYANLDFSSVTDTKNLLAVYEETIGKLAQAVEQQPGQNHSAKINNLLRRMERDGFRYQNGHFSSASLTTGLVHAPSLVRITAGSIQEQVEKSLRKIADGDAAGAIASAYTLIEEFLKQLLRKSGTTFNESEGDIRALYKLVAGPLHLDPKGDSLENYLKSILEGLQRQVAGLFEVANKASDRHARRYNPAPHHAKLAVNTAFTFCEFLLESFEYQQRMKQKRAS
jgi:hypothetical protein